MTRNLQELIVDFRSAVKPYDAQVLPEDQRPDPRFGRFATDGTPRVSPSQVNLLHQCPGKWADQYLNGVPSKQSWQADLGTIGHEGIQAYLEGEDWRLVVDAAAMAVEQHLVETPVDVFQNPPIPADMAAANLSGALERLILWVESNEIEAVSQEQEIRQVLDVDGVRVYNEGRYDIHFRNSSGFEFIGDWKFPGRTYGGAARPEYQYATTCYYEAMLNAGHKLSGFVIVHAGQDGAEIHPDWYFEPTEKIPKAHARSEAGIRRILAGDLPHDNVTPGPLCSRKWCHLHGICPATT